VKNTGKHTCISYPKPKTETLTELKLKFRPIFLLTLTQRCLPTGRQNSCLERFTLLQISTDLDRNILPATGAKNVSQLLVSSIGSRTL
jgi:hypothetical protein